ncbi:MAG: RNA 2',3'-cyclic phosphodiesterase [Kofleriaceae bacterium]
MTADARRLFVAAQLSVGTVNSLAAAAETLARRARDARVDLRFVAPANYHVTVRFLGQTRSDAIPAIQDALDAAVVDATPHKLRTTRLGAFGSLDKARVVWAGVEEPTGQLAAIAKRVEDACVRLGFVPEPRPFHAHVTIARLRETLPVREVVLPVAEQMFGDTRIDAITLFESETKSQGSVYREIHRSAFKPASECQTGPLNLGASNTSSEHSEDVDSDDGWPRGPR